MSKAQLKKVTLTSDYDLDGSLQDAIKALQEQLALIPEEYQGSAEIELESEYDTTSCSARITYARLETEEETRRRIAEQADLEKRRAAREREQYEALKKKFES
jgi:hypothetical protein